MGRRGALRNKLAAKALLNSWFGGGGTPGKAGGACGDGVGDAVTDMSSSWGDWGAPAVVNRPTCVGECLGEVVEWALLQLIDIGPSEVELGSVEKNCLLTLEMRARNVRFLPLAILGEVLIGRSNAANMWCGKWGW